MIDTRSFTEKVLGVPPCEEILYESYFQREFWSLKEFCILMGGLSPDKYENILAHKEENITKMDLKRIEDAQSILCQLLEYFKEKYVTENIQITNDDMRMTTWRFIRWVATNKLPIKERFFNALPLYLMEIYLEFWPTETALRTAHRNSREYHKAYYLNQARQLIKDVGLNLTPTEIYKHPHMQNVQHYIGELKGNYKKRTILESWLPSLEERSRGRPKKSKID